MDDLPFVFVCVASRRVHFCGPVCPYLIEGQYNDHHSCSLTHYTFHDMPVYRHFGHIQSRPAPPTDPADPEPSSIDPPTPALPSSSSRGTKRTARAKNTLTPLKFRGIVYRMAWLLLCSTRRMDCETEALRLHAEKKKHLITKEAKALKIPHGDTLRFRALYRRHMLADLPRPPVVPNLHCLRLLAENITRFWFTLFPTDAVDDKDAKVFTAVCIHELSTGEDKTGVFPKIAWLAACALPHLNLYKQYSPLTSRLMTHMLGRITEAVRPPNNDQTINPAHRFPLARHRGAI